MAPKRKPPRKSPVVFIKAASIVSPTPNIPDAVCEVLDPLITIEKTEQAYDVSVRFNLQEENTSDPPPGNATHYNVKRATGKKIEVEGTGEAAYPNPGLKFRLNVVKEQNIEVTYASEEWKLHVLKSQDVNGKFLVDTIPVKKPRFKWKNLNPFHKSGKAESKIDPAKGARQSNTEITPARTKCILMKWETTTSDLQYLQDEALNGITQTITITRNIPAKQFMLRPEDKIDPKASTDTDMLNYATEYFKFHFHIEIDVKELGRGGVRASLDSIHSFRAPTKPHQLYSSHGNPGKSIEPLSLFDFTISPSELSNDEIRKIRKLLPTEDGYTQSLQNTLDEIHSKVNTRDDVPKKLAFVKHKIEGATPEDANGMPLMAKSPERDNPIEDGESLAIAFIGF